MMTRVKIRKVSAADMVITTVVGLMFFVLSYLGSKQFYMLQTTEQYVTCESAAKDLQDGSDYLTEQVRLYVMTGQQEYMENYFKEANVTCRREHALEELGQYFDGTRTFEALQSALNDSVELMNTEYYAMRLMVEAKHMGGPSALYAWTAIRPCARRSPLK